MSHTPPQYQEAYRSELYPGRASPLVPFQRAFTRGLFSQLMSSRYTRGASGLDGEQRLRGIMVCPTVSGASSWERCVVQRSLRPDVRTAAPNQATARHLTLQHPGRTANSRTLPSVARQIPTARPSGTWIWTSRHKEYPPRCHRRRPEDSSRVLTTTSPGRLARHHRVCVW